MDGDWRLSLVPTIRPGQIWLVAATGDLDKAARAAVANANVVIYERSLAPLIAQMLPFGAYAEPLPRGGPDSGSALSPRALEFAALGWSVVQLAEARPGWLARLRAAAASAMRVDRALSLPVRVMDGGRVSDGFIGDLPDLIRRCADDDFPTLVFGPFGARFPAASLVFTANGLAG